MNWNGYIEHITSEIPIEELLAQYAEECIELAKACLKLRRALDGTNPTRMPLSECLKNFEEELVDCDICSIVFGRAAEKSGRITLGTNHIEKIDEKLKRWSESLPMKKEGEKK